MAKVHLCFSVSFFVVAASAALLLTWTSWWLVRVGPSVPSRRPFFRQPGDVPALIQEASRSSQEHIFQYSLEGGWPTLNSVLRLMAALPAVAVAFAAALFAVTLPHVTTRRALAGIMSIVAALSLLSAVVDAVALANTARECSRRECGTGVPDVVRESGNICICAPDAWFYVTLLADLVLLASATTCAVVTGVPKLAAKAANISDDS